MKNSRAMSKFCWMVTLCIAVSALAAISSAKSATTSINTVSTSVNIVNNSSREIHNVYLSHVNSNDWSGNQLGTATIAPGQSYALNNVACDQQQVKVIGEDQDGCFLTTVVNCGDSATWAITNATPADCGGSQ